jgi:hypothetical protein
MVKSTIYLFNNLMREDVISAEYIDDLNIIAINRTMMQKFNKAEKIILPKLKDKLNYLLDTLEQPHHVIDIKMINKEIEAVQDEINAIESKVKFKEYKMRTYDILQEYIGLGHLKKEIRFKTSGAPDIQEDKNKIKRHELIIQFIEILRNYTDIDIIRISPESSKCTECNNSICTCAGKETEGQKELAINSVSRNNYENRENFRKALMRYQGKELTELPDDLYGKLDKYFENYKLPKGCDIKKLNVNNEWDFKGTSRDLLFKALFDINYRDYYKHVYLICHNYWGWELPDVGYLEDVIMEDYDQSQRVYEKMKPKNKKSCINVQYRLFRLLQKRNHKCKPEDFKIVRTREILEEYEETWEYICDKLGWKFFRIL